MDDTAALVKENIPLASLLAMEYSNIPGSSVDERFSEACLALFMAAQCFEPDKGEFHAFANRAIRNRLNTFYAKQLRLAKRFPHSVDDPILEGWVVQNDSKNTDLRQRQDPKEDVFHAVRRMETESALTSVMKLLSPREQILIDNLRSGISYSEMAEKMGVSKQAVFKSMQAALKKLKLGLDRLGYRGVASDGLLASTNTKK
jgi:RNA polymerase sigma factor (sigma-70 family)